MHLLDVSKNMYIFIAHMNVNLCVKVFILDIARVAKKTLFKTISQTK